jgi:anti-sigma-K factor RskA
MMAVLTCEEVEELAPFYIAGALGRGEAGAIEHHFASCGNHVETFAGLQTTDRFSSDIARGELPPLLKSRLMAAIRSEAGVERAVPSGWQSATHLWAAPRLAFVAAVVIAFLGLLVWNLNLQSSRDDGAFAIALVGDNGASGTVFYRPGVEMGVIAVEGLAKAPDGLTYQVWAALGNGARSCGLLSVTDGSPTAARMEGDVGRKQLVFVTIEPMGGSAKPSGPTVLTTKSR